MEWMRLFLFDPVSWWLFISFPFETTKQGYPQKASPSNLPGRVVQCRGMKATLTSNCKIGTLVYGSKTQATPKLQTNCNTAQCPTDLYDYKGRSTHSQTNTVPRNAGSLLIFLLAARALEETGLCARSKDEQQRTNHAIQGIKYLRTHTQNYLLIMTTFEIGYFEYPASPV